MKPRRPASWAAHPLANSDILIEVLKRCGHNARVYARMALVCKGWRDAIRIMLHDVTFLRTIYRCGTLKMAPSPAEVLPTELVVTRSMARRLKQIRPAQEADLAQASIMPTCVAFHPRFSTAFLVGFADGCILTWFAPFGTTGRGLRPLVFEDTDVSKLAVEHMAFSACGESLLTCSASGFVRIYGVGNAGAENTIAGLTMTFEEKMVTTARATWGEFVGGTSILAICAGVAIVFDREGRNVWTHSPGAIMSSYTVDGRFSATVTRQGAVFIHDVGLRTLLHTISAPNTGGVAWSPNNDSLIVARLVGSSILWRRSAPATINNISNPTPVCYGPLSPAAWTPDGRLALYPNASGLSILRVADDRRTSLEVIDGANNGDIQSISMSPDSRAGVALVSMRQNHADKFRVVVFCVE